LAITAPIIALSYFGGEQARLFMLYSLLPGVVFSVWFQVWLVVRYGGTPGKLLMKLRIAMVDGSPVTPTAAIARFSVALVLSIAMNVGLVMACLQLSDAEYLSFGFVERNTTLVKLAPAWYKAVSILNNIWGGSELIVLLMNKQRRSLHDFMAGTVVVRTESPVAAATAQLES
jgi:uncharacterized RDD family membrane protein YckC